METDEAPKEEGEEGKETEKGAAEVQKKKAEREYPCSHGVLASPDAARDALPGQW
jgi:hypothetical protein